MRKPQSFPTRWNDRNGGIYENCIDWRCHLCGARVGGADCCSRTKGLQDGNRIP